MGFPVGRVRDVGYVLVFRSCFAIDGEAGTLFGGLEMPTRGQESHSRLAFRCTDHSFVLILAPRLAQLTKTEGGETLIETNILNIIANGTGNLLQLLCWGQSQSKHNSQRRCCVSELRTLLRTGHQKATCTWLRAFRLASANQTMQVNGRKGGPVNSNSGLD